MCIRDSVCYGLSSVSPFLIAAGLHFVYTISHKTDTYCLTTLRCSVTKMGLLSLCTCLYGPRHGLVFSPAGAGLLSARTKGAENGRTTVGFLAAPARHLQ